MDKSNSLDTLPRHQTSPSRAIACFAHQPDSDGSSGLEVEADIMDKLSASTRQEHAEVKVQYGKKTKLRARVSSIKGSTTKVSSSSDETLSTSLAVSTSSHRRPTDLYIATDSQLITENDLSDLTSLSSSTRSLSPDITSPIDKNVPKLPLCTPPKAIPLTARLGLKYEDLAELNEPTWSTNDLGSYVWVLLEPKSKRVYDPDQDKNDGKERLWWPAKIQSARNTEIPLKLSLFGSGSKKVEIKAPSVENVLSKLDIIGRLRFNNPAFISASSAASNTASPIPRKKLKRDRGDIENRWEAAVREMILDGEEQAGSDHLPDIGEAFNYHFDANFPVMAPVGVPMDTDKGKSKGKEKEKRKRTCESDDESPLEPPPADATLAIPGELVLGREKPSKISEYWPAQIKAYVPPTKRAEQGKYTVIWLDGSEANIPRDWFYSMDEDGFAFCKLGQFSSSVPEVLNDEDEDRDQDIRRSASPVPLEPPPNNKDFLNLSIREQFVYTKTVLRAILNDEYEPARSKYSRFMMGGKQRASLTDEAALRGRMGEKDVEHLQTYIREWCLREKAPTNIFVDEIENHDDKHLGATMDIQGLVAADRLRSGTPAHTEPDLVSLPDTIPPSSSCASIQEASLILNKSSMTSTTPPSVLESEAPQSSAATDVSNSTNARPSRLMDLRKTTPSLIDVSTPTRQQGYEQYESLSHVDKIEYCVNVLLPEAVRQILLWRSGDRTSIQLLSSAEEEDLYQEGQTLLNERDWVFDIVRYRQMKQRTLQSKIPKGKNGTKSRPRRGFTIPNYM